MKTKVKVEIDCKKILDRRGLGKDQRAAKYLAKLVRQKSDKRVPKQDGDLKNHAKVVPDGGGVGILYPGPYGHYQYHGEVMAGRAPKHYTGKPLDHNQAPVRGSKWDERTMQAEGSQIVEAFAKYVGGQPK